MLNCPPWNSRGLMILLISVPNLSLSRSPFCSLIESAAKTILVDWKKGGEAECVILWDGFKFVFLHMTTKYTDVNLRPQPFWLYAVHTLKSPPLSHTRTCACTHMSTRLESSEAWFSTGGVKIDFETSCLLLLATSQLFFILGKLSRPTLLVDFLALAHARVMQKKSSGQF